VKYEEEIEALKLQLAARYTSTNGFAATATPLALNKQSAAFA